ncbi:MAG: AEC family transporter [Microbacteriaceae bacterium]|nr:AEC family transporter [Microbacteriaceae bacterium]
MIGVLQGFAVIAAVVVAGWLVGRAGLLGPHADFVLGRIAFFVLSPPLLFTVLARADVHKIFSTQLPVALAAAVAMFAVFAVVARVFWRRRTPELVVGALASGYQNGNNIGLPISLYVLGDAAASAPVILLQMVVFAPIALTILDVTTSPATPGGHRGRGIARTLLTPLRNPLLIASVLGIVCAATGWLPPEPVMAPFDFVGAAAVPVLLLNFGLALSSGRVLAPGPYRRDVVLASALKLVAMPVLAWALAHFVFGLEGHLLFTAVVLAALPAANNVFNYAQRYDRGVTLARDAVFITTLGCIPVLLVIAWLLGD